MNMAAKLSTDDTKIRRPGEAMHLIRLLAGTGRVEDDRYPQPYPRQFGGTGGSRPSSSGGAAASRFRYMNLYNVPGEFGDHGMQDNAETGEGEDGDEDVDASQMSLGEILTKTQRHLGPSGDEMLAELPYTLQGITTQIFPWKTTASSKSIVLGIPDTLIWPNIGLVNQLLEPALLYKTIKERLQDRESESRRQGAKPIGLVEQALHSAIDEELQGYLTLVGVVESEVRRQQQQQQDAASRNKPRRVTIRRCIVLLQEATLGLRLVHSIMKESEGLVGGQILSLMHGYTFNGDDLVSRFAKRLLPSISTPFYSILNQWIGCGQLVDPHDEFFVQTGNEESMWENRFLLDETKVPSYMGKEVAEKVFQIGKTLYFVRVACEDQDWVEERQAAAIAAAQRTTAEDDSVDELEARVSKAYVEVVKHLNEILRNKFGLDSHLRGLKDYLLLGKGDFVQLLVETVAPSLDKPAVQLFRHHLTATLETAIRGSNAQHDPADVLRSLDARMLELGHGDIGWDVFTLDYRVEQPLDTVILDRGSMTEYLRVFNFLWRIKRVSYALNRTWRRMATSERSGQLSVSLRRHYHQAQEEEDMIAVAQYMQDQWVFVRGVCGEMLHFIGELQYYINYEVVEMSWVQLQRELNGTPSTSTGEGDKVDGQTDVPVLSVDEIIAAHKRYLAQITYKGLLGGGEELMGELHDILKSVLAFRACVDGLHDLTARFNTSSSTTGSTAQQDWGRVQNLGAMVHDLRAQFEQSVETLVEILGRQEDGEMRFLGVRLDFNGFYTRMGEQRRGGERVKR